MSEIADLESRLATAVAAREEAERLHLNASALLDAAEERLHAAEARAERLEGAATGALAVLTRLADSAAYRSDYDVPVGIVSEIDAVKARLAAALAAEGEGKK